MEYKFFLPPIRTGDAATDEVSFKLMGEVKIDSETDSLVSLESFADSIVDLTREHANSWDEIKERAEQRLKRAPNIGQPEIDEATIELRKAQITTSEMNVLVTHSTMIEQIILQIKERDGIVTSNSNNADEDEDDE